MYIFFECMDRARLLLLFIVLCKTVLTSESVNEVLIYINTYFKLVIIKVYFFAEFVCGAVYYAVQSGSNF